MTHFSLVLVLGGLLIFLRGDPSCFAENIAASEMSSFSSVEDILQDHFNEPSGIVFHDKRGTLFVVGDEGDIGEVRLDGTLIRHMWLFPADFEGITYDPTTGLLYVAVEGEEQILEIDPQDFSVIREFSLDRMFEGRMLLFPGGDGLEAISFVPDSGHPEGGTFYLTNQGFDQGKQDDLSIIIEVELPLRSHSMVSPPAKIMRVFSLGIEDLSGLYYDQDSDHLFVISDATDTLIEISMTGEILHSYHLPGEDQEGITKDHSGFFYLVQDSGGIIRFLWENH